MKSRASKTIIFLIVMLLLVFIVTIGVSLCVATPIASAQSTISLSETEEPTDLTFLLNDDGQSYSVRILDKTLKNISIPSTYNNLPVTAIDDGGFTGCTALEKIFIPSSVKYIGNNAFMRCTNLKKVLGMSGVTFYGNNAFSMCSKLEYLILPSGIKNAGTYMLRNVKANVYSRTLENDLVDLNAECLNSFSGNIIYGNELVYEDYIDPQTGEAGLSLVSWQNLDLYENGFKEGTTLEISSWIENIQGDASKKGKLLNIADSAFAAGNFYDSTLECNAKKIIIKNAEGYNHSINIESYAFSGSGVEEITIDVDFTLNDSSGGMSTGIFHGSENLKSVTLLDSIEIIPEEMFSDCNALIKIKFANTEENYLPSKVKRIEAKAFYGCTKMPELHINKEIEYIGENAFVYWGKTNNMQTLYIDLEEAGADWDSRWKYNVNEDIIDYVGLKEVEVQFIVEQQYVINAKGDTNKMVPRNSTLRDLNLTAPTSDSHLFNGKWYTSESRDSESEFDLDKPIKSEMKLYAGWEIKEFTVTFGQVNCCKFFDSESEECIDLQVKTINHGSGYKFRIKTNPGYYNTKIYVNGKLLLPTDLGAYDLINVVQDLVITAQAELFEYEIKYENVRKGNNPNSAITKFTVESETIQFANPTWGAYELGYWDIPSIPKGTVPEDNKNYIVVTAVWKNPIEVEIKFKMDNDPNASNPNGTSKKYTVEEPVKLLDPDSPGYMSGGWKTKDGTVVTGWNVDEHWENMELNVNWGEANKYDVVLDYNDGTGRKTAIKAEYGKYLPSGIISIPTRTYYLFNGFVSKNNGSQYYDANMNAKMVWYQAKSDTLSAKWIDNYITITFEQRGGTGTGGETLIIAEIGSPWPQINMPYRQGYYVKGYFESYELTGSSWQYYNEYGKPLKGTVSKDQGDITLFASWHAYTYNLYVDAMTLGASIDGGSSVRITTLNYATVETNYTHTADETMTYTYKDGSKATYGFTAWEIIWREPAYYDEKTNPWHVLTHSQTIDINIGNILSKYYSDIINEDGWSYTLRAVFTQNISSGSGSSGGGSCIADGTLITLADGCQIPVEQLTGNEKLLVWNLFTGNFDVAPILFIDSDPAKEYEIINLRFSDGTSVKVISEHAFWDCNLNKYVFLRADAAKYIGHWFNKQITSANGEMKWTKVQLVDVELTTEITTAWSPVTYGHLCYYVNGMLSMPGATESFINIFDVDAETMKIDEVAFEQDIETYGLFTYEEFAELLPIPEVIFEAFGGQYLKVAIGKGLTTMEELETLIQRYEKFFN